MIMRMSRLSLVMSITVISLLIGGMVYAADGDRGGGRTGGYDGGGSRSYGHGGHDGGGHHGGHGGHYYGGWGHYNGYYGTGFGVMIGDPYWGWPWYYPLYAYPYANYNPYVPAVTMQSDEPQEYIQRSDKVSPPDSSGVWYYCPESKIYYPYVKECPGGWQTVPAQPLSEQGR